MERLRLSKKISDPRSFESDPEAKSKYPDVVDTVHRFGRRSDDTKPRGVIMQFSSRVICDALWKAAKKSQFLEDNNLRFVEALTSLDRERQKSLWPRVREARAAGKMAYYKINLLVKLTVIQRVIFSY